MVRLDFLTVKDAATNSGYTERYIRQLCREGKLEFTRVGNVYLINPESLKNYVNTMKRLGPEKFGIRR